MSDHAHHEPSFWGKIFSLDHKVIAKQYMITGLIMAIIGGLTAAMLRTQLASDGVLDKLDYNAMVTMHGTIMIFWVAMPVLVAGFGNLLIPLMIGTDDMAFPWLNMASYWLFLVSTIILLSSFFVEGAAASGGWTSYPPLSGGGAGATGDGLHNPSIGVDLWIIAVALEFFAFLIGGINFITSAINMRAPGMGIWDIPMFVWTEVAASIIFMLSVGPLIAGAVMLLLDRTAGTHFYNPAHGGDPILFQHLFWFFGHPEVYVILLPAFGILAETITTYSRKPLLGYKAIVYSILATGILSFVVWAHHQFVAGIDPRLAAPFGTTTILISVPIAVMLFSLIGTMWRGSIRYNSAMLFSAGTLITFLVGGLTGLICGIPAADIYIHDSYYIVAHFHYAMFPLVFFAAFAGIYHWYPKMFGRHLNEKLGKIHFFGTFVFFNTIFLPMFEMGMRGHHRRIAVPTNFDYLSDERMLVLQKIATHSTYALLAFQFIFFVNFFLSMKVGKKAAENPWNSTTFEWACPSPPPHGNFPKQPVAYRGAYEYSTPDCKDDDFIPQGQAPAQA